MKMTIREEIKMILAKRAVSVKKLVKILKEKKGIDIKAKTLYSRINNRIIRFEDVRDIMDVLDYKIEFKDIS